MLNSVNRLLPDYIESYGVVKPYNEQFIFNEYNKRGLTCHLKSGRKLKENFFELFKALDIKDGMTVSFHHHLKLIV